MMTCSPLLKTAAVLLLAAAGCGKSLAPAGPGTPGKAADLSRAQNDFGLRLFSRIAHENPGTDNQLISPVSLYVDLALAYNGAAGVTARGMARALGLEGTPLASVNAAAGKLMTLLPREDSSVRLDIANAIWYRDQGSRPLSSFLATAQNDYQAEVTGAPFDHATVEAINDWVSRKTQGKIDAILERIDPADISFLLNAVYFKGAWQQAFDSTATASRPFHISGGKEAQTAFMYREAKYNYLENDSLQAIELPYGNGSFSMYVFLPRTGTTPEDWAARQTAASLDACLGAMDSAKVKLWLPKWRYATQQSDLSSVLSAMGMGDAFSDHADFSQMYPAGTRMKISRVIHKAFIDVNERGTEAAAVTSIGMTVTSMPLHPTPVMDVNRPFFYLIREKTSGLILFMGIVQNPDAN